MTLLFAYRPLQPGSPTMVAATRAALEHDKYPEELILRHWREGYAPAIGECLVAEAKAVGLGRLNGGDNVRTAVGHFDHGRFLAAGPWISHEDEPRCPPESALDRLHNEGGNVSRLIRRVWKLAGRIGYEHWKEDLEAMVPDCGDALYQLKGLRGSRRVPMMKLAAINHMLKGYRVDELGTWKRSGNLCAFIDAGDSYLPTLFADGDRLFISTVGDEIERKRVNTWSY